MLLALVFAAIGAQLLRLAIASRNEPRLASAEPIARTFSRPDIVDREGRIIATDVGAPSLFADPALILDLDEMIEKLVASLSGLDETELRRTLSDRSRRFAWIRRGLAPVEAQRIHELGLPGLAFRREPKRVYPSGALTGHIAGHVNVDNRGIAGIERYIDETMALDLVIGAGTSAPPGGAIVASISACSMRLPRSWLPPLRLMLRLRQPASSWMCGRARLLAAVSLPAIDPNQPAEALDPARADRLQAGVYELGSIFKALTVARPWRTASRRWTRPMT